MATLKVDPDLCIGCGLCITICPLVFELRDNKAWLIKPGLIELDEKKAVVSNPDACETCDCLLAINTCPVAAISFE
ncbi:MAG TPA: ferredoxin [Spirochaetota bacterium]